MQRRLFLAAACGLALPGAAALSGCASRATGWDSPQMAELLAAQQRRRGSADAGIDNQMARQRLLMSLVNEPDLPEWHAQREKMALAIGDRSFEKPFDRVFDSMTVALSTLGSRVNNMERSSGYITASIPSLGPTRTASMQKAAIRQYAAAKGYPASLLDRSAADGPFELDVEGSSGMMMRHMAGMTLSLVRQGKVQTKVKLRFDNVYYPELVAEYYRLVWTAVDKQMFLDQSLD